MRQSVLMTGASSGIGAATATLLTQRGFRVFGTSREPERVRERLAAVDWVKMDVSDEASVRVGVQNVLSAVPHLDALVCCAGYGVFGSIEETSPERARAQFDVNVFGTVLPVCAVLPHMRERGSGRVVIVGSLSGRAAIPFQGHYSATKAALDTLVFALRNELHPYGVRVTLIEPGDIRTEFNDRTDWGDPARSAYGERIRRCEQIIKESLPHAPGPELVARAILRALTARRPRVRYAVGPASFLVPLGRRLLPDRLVLALVRRHFRV